MDSGASTTLPRTRGDLAPIRDLILPDLYSGVAARPCWQAHIFGLQLTFAAAAVGCTVAVQCTHPAYIAASTDSHRQLVVGEVVAPSCVWHTATMDFVRQCGGVEMSLKWRAIAGC